MTLRSPEARLRIDGFFAALGFFADLQRSARVESQGESAEAELVDDLSMENDPASFLWGVDGLTGAIPPSALSFLRDRWVDERFTVRFRFGRELFWLEHLCPATVYRAESQASQAHEDEERVVGFASIPEAIRVLRQALEEDPSAAAQACLAELESSEQINKAEAELNDDVEPAEEGTGS